MTKSQIKKSVELKTAKIKARNEAIKKCRIPAISKEAIRRSVELKTAQLKARNESIRKCKAI